MSGQSAASAFSRPGAPSTTTSSGLGNPRRTRSSSSARQAASLSPPMDLIASSTFWPSARTPSATSSETAVAFRSSRTRATVPSRIKPDDRLLGERAPIPGIPIALHLAPGPADHVLADRPSERRGKRPPHPAGVGSRKIGPGDQGVGGPGAALIGAKRTAPPFARLAVVPHQPSARHGDPRLAKRARQRPFAMAVAHAHDRRRRVLARPAPTIARTRQRLGKFRLQHRLDEAAHPSPDPVLDRVEPIIEKQTLGSDNRLLRGILRHGVVSVPARQRRNHLG